MFILFSTLAALLTAVEIGTFNSWITSGVHVVVFALAITLIVWIASACLASGKPPRAIARAILAGLIFAAAVTGTWPLGQTWRILGFALSGLLFASFLWRVLRPLFRSNHKECHCDNRGGSRG